MNYLKLSITAIWVLLMASCHQPESSGSSAYSTLSVSKPDGWFDFTETSIRENVERYDLSEEKVDELMRTHNGSITVALYTKHDMTSHPEIMPTIQVTLRPNPYQDYWSLKQALISNAGEMGKLLDNFRVLGDYRDVEVGGIRSLHFLSTFDMSTKDGSKEKVRSWTYAVPSGKYFYQINFSDVRSEDCAGLYKKVIESVRFEN